MREASGSTNIEKTLLKALKVLKLFNIPHYLCGGFAVQEHGYPPFTVDVDIIVPDVAFAIEKLSMNGFKVNPGSKMTITDRETKVEVYLLPGGEKVDPGPLTLPMPARIPDEPQILTLEKLISAKLSTYIGRGMERSQDQADVVKLLQANDLPRDFAIDVAVRDSITGSATDSTKRTCEGKRWRRAVRGPSIGRRTCLGRKRRFLSGGF